MKRLINAVKVGKLSSLLGIAALFSMLGGVVFCSDVYAQADQPGPDLIGEKAAADESDSDGMVCFNKHKTTWQGVGFITFSKSTESSKQSNFFTPKIKVRYGSWGWIPFTSDYYKIQSWTADLGATECSRMAGVRFCARYAGPAGTQLDDGTTLEEDQYGYDPGRCTCRPKCQGVYNNTNSPCCTATDLEDPNNTCCENSTISPIPNKSTCMDPGQNKTNRKDSCVSPLRFKVDHVTRLCAYEDAWDLADTDEDSSPFHKMDDVCAKYEDPDAQEQCIKTAAGNYALMGAGLGGPGAIAAIVAGSGGIGLLILGIAAAIGALIAVFTGGAMNYDVMTTTPGTSLGCVDIPMAPPPPVYYYTLQSSPPWPQVLPVSDNAADFETDVLKYPATLTKPLGDPGHPESWRVEENKDWFYPKIGVMLGQTELEQQGDGSEMYVPSSKRATRVLTGDFYGEGPDIASWQLIPAGNGRYEPLPDLVHAEGSDKRQLRNSTLSITIEQDDGSTANIQYKVSTEVYDNKVCAYVVGANFTVNGSTPGSNGPELIGCVDRPQSYYAMYTDPNNPPKFIKGDPVKGLIKGIPYPQIFHPWYNPSEPGYPTTLTPYTSSQASNPDASTYNEPKFIWWLVHDPRQTSMMNPLSTSGYDTYEEYRANDTVEAKAFKDNKVLGTRVNIPQLGCDSVDIPTNPITNLQPQWTSTWTGASGVDYFKRDVNRRHRIHGVVYCVENYDKDKNGRIDVEDSDLCAQFIGDGKTLEKLERPGATPVGYVGVKFTGKVRIPDPYPRQVVTMPSTAVNPPPPASSVYTTFPGPIVDVNGDINNVAQAVVNGNYKNGIRFFSTDPAIGCNKKLVEATGDIVTDSCKQENINGTPMYYRDPPDPLRGEMITNVNGRDMLVRRKYGTAANEADTYPTKLNKSAYNQGDEVAGECPLALLPDGLTFTPQMPPDGCCAATAGACSDPAKWVDPSQRRYTIPDILRGQKVRKSDQFEEGLNKGYCVKIPPSGCPRLVANTSNGIDGTHVWTWEPTFANYTDPHEPDEIGVGIGKGNCMPGYGAAKILSGSGLSATYSTTEGTYGEQPLRRCDKGNINFNAEGVWGTIIRPCLPLYCPGSGGNATFFSKDRDCVDWGPAGTTCTTHYFACEWPKTQSLYWAQASDIGDGNGKCGDCAGASGARYTEWRVKYCDETGQWKDYTCRGDAGWPQGPTTTSSCYDEKINDSNGSPSSLCSDGY